MKKKIIIIAFVAVFLVLGTVFAIGAMAKDDGVTPQEMADRIPSNSLYCLVGRDCLV